MYRCESCRQVVGPGTPSIIITIETREKYYSRRAKANIVRREGKAKTTDDPGGKGAEILREIRVCPDCAHAQVAASDSHQSSTDP